MVATADPWPLVWAEVEPILRDWVIEFITWVRPPPHPTVNAAHGVRTGLADAQAFCVMKLFAAYYGEWNPRYNGFKSQKLEFAGRVCQLDLANTHHAIDDARLTAALLGYIAARG